MLIAVLYLLWVQAGADAPLRSSVNSYSQFADIEHQIAAADIDPAPAQMHFMDPNPSPSSALRFGRVYYMAQYLRYPHRLLIGKGDHIINNQIQLMAADQMPSASWMHQQRVSWLYFVYDLGPIGPRMEVHPLH